MKISEMPIGGYSKLNSYPELLFAKKENDTYCIHKESDNITTCSKDKLPLLGECTEISEEEFISAVESIESIDWYVLMLKEGLLTNQL